MNLMAKKTSGIVQPFLHSKSKKCENTLLTLDIDGVIEQDQCKIADHFAKYFCSVANNIGDTRLLGMSEDQLYYHGSVQLFRQRLSKESVKAYATMLKGNLGNIQ